QLYTLNFDLGTVASNTNEQRLQVTLQGSGVLVNQVATINGVNDGQSHWSARTIAFTANSSITTLTFTDVSLVTQAIDMMLDHVRVTTSTAHTLTITSTPNSALNITVAPGDMNGATSGLTQFSRTYTAGAVVNLTAPAT